MSRYLLDRRRTGTAYAARLSKQDVADIRRWAGTEGFGLSRIAQVTALQAIYPFSYGALLNVLQNASFYDPTYTPRARCVVQERPVQWGMIDWLTIVLLWRILCAYYAPSSPSLPSS